MKQAIDQLEINRQQHWSTGPIRDSMHQREWDFKPQQRLFILLSFCRLPFLLTTLFPFATLSYFSSSQHQHRQSGRLRRTWILVSPSGPALLEDGEMISRAHPAR